MVRVTHTPPGCRHCPVKGQWCGGALAACLLADILKMLSILNSPDFRYRRHLYRIYETREIMLDNCSGSKEVGMEGRVLIIAKMVTLIVALAGLCVLIYSWFIDKRDAPLILSGILSGLIFAILGFNKAKTEPDPQRGNDNDDEKKDDVSVKGKEATNGL